MNNLNITSSETTSHENCNTTNFIKITISTLLLFLVSAQSLYAYEPGDWFVRLGPAFIEPNDDSNEIDGIPGSELSVDNDVTLGFTIGYMLTNNFAIELLGITPSSHDINARGSISSLGKVADVDVFPPTLSLQYHLKNSSSIQPYVGIGVNYTHFSSANATSSLETALGGDTDIDIDDSWGLAGQVGADIAINDSWNFNAAIWYIDIDADATLETNGVSRDVDIDVDPWVFFIGIGKTF